MKVNMYEMRMFPDSTSYSVSVGRKFRGHKEACALKKKLSKRYPRVKFFLAKYVINQPPGEGAA